ncbi:tetratricopeptide repeat protein [Ruminococcus sp.]|uniref:tetratricopeptide repeat protein n=1 Tax=Ruminococcus sp. TaxID=41978 RepID=UPI003FD82406
MEKQFEEMYDRVFDYINAGRTAEAMQVAQQLVDTDMSIAESWWAYANAKESWGDNELAKKGYEQVIAIKPDFVDGYVALANIYIKSDNEQYATELLKKAIEIDELNVYAQDMLVRCISDIEGVDNAIRLCEHFIEISEEKIVMQNLLGELFVDKADEYIVRDIPNVLDDPSQGVGPGFVSIDDIEAARTLCKKARALLTLDDQEETIKYCDEILQACDEDQYQTMRISGWFFLISHAFITTVIYLLLSPFIIGIPCLLIAPWATFKANYMPLYMVNYAYYTGTGDPLAYKNERLANLQRAAADNGILEGDFGNILKAHIWVIRSRISYYKRFLKARKEKKQNKQLNAN